MKSKKILPSMTWVVVFLLLNTLLLSIFSQFDICQDDSSFKICNVIFSTLISMISLLYGNLFVNCFRCCGYADKSEVIKEDLHNATQKVINEMISIVQPYLDNIPEEEYDQKRDTWFLMKILYEYQISNSYLNRKEKLLYVTNYYPITDETIDRALVKVPGVDKKRLPYDKNIIKRDRATILEIANILAKLED